jgi:seryl-tRNA synthetase
MIDIRLLRDDPDAVTAALARRGVDPAEVERIVALDVRARQATAAAETVRARVKVLSREVGQARRDGVGDRADELAAESRSLGDQERSATREAEILAEELRTALLYLPNIPADNAPDGTGAEDNVEVRRWWPGQAEGAEQPVPADHQRVPHWEIGEQLGLLQMEWGARLSGSMFPLYRGAGARLVRALTAFALDRHSEVYEEIRPPTLVLTETMESTGHLPKFSDEAYHIERDDLWAIPTAEVPLTSLRRGEILDEADLPMRFTAVTACYRREAGAAGRDTRGLLRVHEFEKVELFCYATPDQAREAFSDIVARASGLLEELGLTYRLLDLCTGDLGSSSARTFDLEVFSPGVDRWLEVSSVSWFKDYQARRANVRYRPAGGPPAFVHTFNGSALAWPRIWAALVEQGRQADGSVRLPDCLAPYTRGELVIGPPAD